MGVDDIPDVHAIESASFSVPWPSYAFRQEIETNRLARYMVAREGDAIVGYAGIWLMVDEAHITTFAVAPEHRRSGIGETLLQALLALSAQVGASVATLEVRVSNMPARRLYEKYGFRPVGVRPRYYTDNGEDALIMTTGELGSREMRDRLARLAAQLEARRAMAVATPEHASPAGDSPITGGQPMPGSGGTRDARTGGSRASETDGEGSR
jgi:ribosomal-protein-alanine N-acetyltransferase